VERENGREYSSWISWNIRLHTNEDDSHKNGVSCRRTEFNKTSFKSKLEVVNTNIFNPPDFLYGA
jgi:hypothetical protein